MPDHRLTLTCSGATKIQTWVQAGVAGDDQLADDDADGLWMMAKPGPMRAAGWISAPDERMLDASSQRATRRAARQVP